jgi:cytochrome b
MAEQTGTDNTGTDITGKAIVEVWDLPIRLFHWSLVACLVALWATGEFGFMDLHEIVGVAVLILILFRVFWGFVGGEFARFASFVRGPNAVKAYLAAVLRWKLPKQLGHNPIGGWSALAMLAALWVQSAMGLFTIDEARYAAPFTKYVSVGTARWFTDLHELGFNIILVLVGIHLAAIALYLVMFRKNLVSPMIRGTTLAEASVIPPRVRPGRVWLAICCLALSTAILIWGVYFL